MWHCSVFIPHKTISFCAGGRHTDYPNAVSLGFGEADPEAGLEQNEDSRGSRAFENSASKAG